MDTSLILKPRAKFESFGGVNFAPPPNSLIVLKGHAKYFDQQQMLISTLGSRRIGQRLFQIRMGLGQAKGRA